MRYRQLSFKFHAKLDTKAAVFVISRRLARPAGLVMTTDQTMMIQPLLRQRLWEGPTGLWVARATWRYVGTISPRIPIAIAFPS